MFGEAVGFWAHAFAQVETADKVGNPAGNFFECILVELFAGYCLQEFAQGFPGVEVAEKTAENKAVEDRQAVFEIDKEFGFVGGPFS